MDRKILGERIRRARDKRGFSQEQLARLVNKDQRAISEFEAGTRKLPATDIPIFAAVLGVNILYFFEGEYGDDDLDLAILKAFHRIGTPDMKKTAIRMIYLLTEPPSLPPESE
jgi:transcriptional regulator with XRE-family HTH domain